MIGDVCFSPSKFEWYIFIVLFSNGCSRNCNDLIFTSSYDIYLYRLRPALSSGGIRITKFRTVFKKQGGVNPPRFLKCIIPPWLTLFVYLNIKLSYSMNGSNVWGSLTPYGDVLPLLKWNIFKRSIFPSKLS